MSAERTKAKAAPAKPHPGRQASPWSRGPNCATPGARLSYVRYVAKGRGK